jgi:hypothetical protein
MNFKSYAISRKLKNNSDLIKYLNEGTIPVEVIEKEFSEVFALYKDEEAELLSEDYREYLRKHVPVSFIPTSKGLDVKGNISDNVLNIINDVHGVEKYEVVSTVVHDVVETVSPNRKFNVSNVLFSEELNKLTDRVEEHKKQLVDMTNENKIVSALEIKSNDESISIENHNEASYTSVDVDKLVEKEVASEVEKKSDAVEVEKEPEVKTVEEKAEEKAEETVSEKDGLVTDHVDFNIDEVIEGVEKSETKEFSKEDVAEEAKEETKEEDAELRKEIWNNFVMDLADKKMNERIATRQDLALAL